MMSKLIQCMLFIIVAYTAMVIILSNSPATKSVNWLELVSSWETIVSAFAFFGLITALRLQRKELKLQRKDLKLQRKEMSDTRKVLDDQKKQMELQNEQLKTESINNEFFTRYKLFLEVIGTMKKEDYSGRRFLFVAGNHYKEMFNNDRIRYTNNLIILCEDIVERYGPFGLYWFFPSLYNLIAWCKNQPNATELINIILDEFTPIEKRVVYYSVFFNDQFKNLRSQLLDIGFIESLTDDVFMSEEHRLKPPHLL